jgi:hypothetical protein
MFSSKGKYNKYFKIEEHKIYTTVKCIVYIDLNEYKISDEDIETDEDNDFEDSMNIPGIFTVNIPEENDTVDFYFDFNINLIYPSAHSKEKNIVKLEYEAGDLLVYAETKSVDTNIEIIAALFDNRVKYIRGDVQTIIKSIYKQMSGTVKMKMHHISTILTTLYGEDTEDGFKPIRLTKKQDYNKSNALSTKESAHKLGVATGFNYGYNQEAINNNITRKYDPPKSDMDNIIDGDYDKIEVGKRNV